MSERCDLSDLPVEMCACRVHGPKEERTAPTVGPVFAARYDGRCAVCDGRAYVGDRCRVLIVDGCTTGIVHEGCEP